MKLKVSVIIPTYNREEFLPGAIDSVLKQSYRNFELIIVDDGSTDKTKNIIDRYNGKLTYLYQDNKGVAAARNRGIAASRHALIAFLDSDDRFASKKLEMQVEAMEQNPSVMISHTQEKWYRRGKFLNQKKKHRKESGNLFKRCLELCAVGMSTIMARKELFNEVGFFDESLPCCEDYDLWLRVSVNFPFLLVDEPLTIKNGGRPDQLSVQYRVGMDSFRVQSILNLINTSSLSDKQFCLACQELVKKSTILANGFAKHGKMEQASFYQDIIKKFSSDPQ